MTKLINNKLYLLRDFTFEDEVSIRKLDSDPEVMKYISNGIPSDEAEVKRAMGVFLSFQNKFDGKYGYWLLEDKDDHSFVGWFHLRPLKSDPENLAELELGYRLMRKYWGRGIATDISKELIQYGFNELKANNIWAHTMKANLASQKVMQKCGMQFSHEDSCAEFPGEDKTTVWYKINLG